MRDRSELEARIVELRGELDRAEGSATEVYSRIVGYYRSVRNWNAGKRVEYGQRRAFGLPAVPPTKPITVGMAGDTAAESAATAPAASVDCARKQYAAPVAAAVLSSGARALEGGARVPEGSAVEIRDGVLVFTREACPNCSPVANYVMGVGINALFVDVDREEGFDLARKLGVMSTPTVLGMDAEGRESFRAFGLKELKARVEGSAAGLPG